MVESVDVKQKGREERERERAREGTWKTDPGLGGLLPVIRFFC